MTTARTMADTAAILDPDTYVRGVPYDSFARLRRDAPVTWVEEPPIDHWPAGTGFWAVMRHSDVQRVLRTPQVFSSSLGLTQIYDAPPALLPYMRKMMINMDPPVHSRLRGLLTKAFTPRAVAGLEERIRQRAYALVDAVIDRGGCDFAKDLAADLPLLTLADTLGVPESDRWLMFDWSNRVIGVLDAEYSASSVFNADGASEMARRAIAVRPKPDANGRMPDSRRPDGMADLYLYARELGEHKRANPGDDVMSILMREVDVEGSTPAGGAGRVSIDEFETLFWLFSVAGNETVRNALPGGLYALLQHPDQYRRLQQDRSLLSTAVDEILRWWAPVIQSRRTAAVDTEIGGVEIKAGQKVVAYLASANRDESVFADPDGLDVGRTPNDHVSFGHGPHFCVAARLARVQMHAMFAAVLDRFAHVELTAEPVRLRSNFQNGVKHLPIRWRPA
jgi:cytochrome P450